MLRGSRRGLELVLWRWASGGSSSSSSSSSGGQGSGSTSGSSSGSARPQPLEPSLLRFLVCPLSKRPLRYEEATSELINEELGIAYPVIDGIPNMIPEAARTTRKKPPAEELKQP